MRLAFFRTFIVFAAGFVLFAVLYHQHQVKTIHQAVQEHARIVAGSVWDLNPVASLEYLRAVAENNHYAEVVIKNIDGREFTRVAAPAPNLFEKELIRLKLIPEKFVFADIFHGKERIGTVTALWLDKSVYAYAYAFLVALLLFVVVQLYSRILTAKNTLEKKVAERTRNLTRKTEELQSVQALLQYSEELHRVTMGSISDPVFITDDDGNFTYIGANVSQGLGYSVAEIDAMKTITALVGRPLFAVTELRKSGEIRNIDVPVAGKDGVVHFFLVNVKYVSIDIGTVLYVFHDISDLKSAYDAQAESEESYRTLAENLPGLVYRLFLTEGNRIQLFNPMLEPMTGFREAEIPGGHICPLAFGIVPEDRDRIISAVSRAIDEKNPFDMEYAFSHQSGAVRYFHERGRPVFDENNVPLYIDGVIFDVTENKETVIKHQELEKQLRQAQKLEALGALAGGITHDFNNILSSIYGYSQLALLELPEDSTVRAYLKDMHAAANRARELVKQILTFSRQEPQTQSPVEVGIIVKEALKLLRASIPATVEIRQNIDRTAGSVMANPTQIHQILMNLCTNAYHAMRETGGVLGVSLAREEMTDGAVVNGVSLVPGSYLHLEVSDTGHGMDEDMLDRIFEPYFTTKPRGEGTGMGLSVVHGIVKSHGGQTTATSSPGKGSTFHVYWPAIAGTAMPIEMEPAAAIARGHETILLVDDEAPTLMVEESILERLGYRVDAFTDPHAALAAFREKTQRFDLVVTDMTMPEMTGVDFFKAVRALRPDIPVVLCTGYSEMISEKTAEKIGLSAFILKPVEIGEFAVLLRKLLDGRNRRAE